MRKLLTILLILSCFLLQAATTGRIIRVPSATTTFSENIPIGTLIIDTNTGIVYNTLQPIASTKSISSCSLATELEPLGSIYGTANYIGKFTDHTIMGNSLLFDNGSTMDIGYGGTHSEKFAVNGSGYFNTDLTVSGLASTYSRLTSTDYTGKFTPISDGLTGQVLQTNGIGGYSWLTITSGQVYKGTWDALFNVPSLANGTGTAGWYYRCTVAGTSLGISFNVGDDVSYNGSTWQRIPGASTTFPTATPYVLGGIKIGSGITMTSDVASVSTAYRPDTWVPVWSDIVSGKPTTLAGYATDTPWTGLGYITGISGTANRISTSGTAIDISSAYVGQTSITTLGTVGTGTWNGSAIADTYISSSGTWNGKQNALSGTGLVRMSGTSVSYDNTTYLSNVGTGNASTLSLASVSGTPVFTPVTASVSSGGTALTTGGQVYTYGTANFVAIADRYLVWNGSGTGAQLNSSYFTLSGGWKPTTQATPTYLSDFPLSSGGAYTNLEPKITAGTTSQYWRGDKTWQTLPGYQTLAIGGTTYPSITLSNSGGTVLFNGTNGISLSQGSGYINISGTGFGTTSTTACVGNDYRLSDSRNPTAHTLDSHSNITITSKATNDILKWNGSAWVNTPIPNGTTPNSVTFQVSGGATSGTSFNGSVAKIIDYSTVGAASLNGSASQVFSALNYTIGTCSITMQNNSGSLGFWNGSSWIMQLTTGGALSTTSTTTSSNFILSDRRLKRNIKSIDFTGLDKVRWVQFTMKSDSSHKQRYGVVAQDLEEIAPQFVNTANDSMKTKSVNYTDLIVAKLAQMEAKITDLETRIKKLEDEKK